MEYILIHSKKRLCCCDQKFVILGTAVEMCRDTFVSWLEILVFPRALFLKPTKVFKYAHVFSNWLMES